MTLAGLVRAKQDFAIAVFRHLARLLALFFVLGSLCSPAFADYRVSIGNGPFTVEYGDRVTLTGSVSQSCSYGYCAYSGVSVDFVNQSNGVAFASNNTNWYSNTTSRTFIAGVAEDGKTLLQLGPNNVVAMYNYTKSYERYINVAAKKVGVGFGVDKSSVQIGEWLNLSASAIGYLATGNLSIEMIDPKNVSSTVTSQGWGTPTNQMQFGIGMKLFVPGTYRFKAKFSSTVNTNVGGDSETYTITVAPATTTNTLAISRQAPIPLASPFVLTSSITGAYGVATGIVEFYDGDVVLGRAYPQNNQASIATALTKDPGTHNFRAKYLGDEYNAASVSADVSVVFSQAQPVTTVVSSQNPLVWSAPVTLDARITGANPAGQMAFYDGENLLGSSTIAAGAASLSISSLPVGDHSITARFAGDVLNLASTSAPLLQKVGKADTVVQLTSINSAPITPGSSLIFMADVSGTGSGRSGTVSFYDGTALLGSSTLQNNQATLGSIKLAAVGMHQIRAQYSGDQNFNAGTSSNLGINIEMASTTSALRSSAASVYNRAPISFTLTVTGVSPTGTASFFVDGKPAGTAALVDGVATLTTKLAKTGRRVITATYSGDAGNLPSTAPAFTQLVKINPAILQLLIQSMND